MIQRCISSRAFAPETSISTMAEASARAGFDGVELVVNARGELNLATPLADVPTVLRHFGEQGLAVAALTSDQGRPAGNASARHRAHYQHLEYRGSGRVAWNGGLLLVEVCGRGLQ